MHLLQVMQVMEEYLIYYDQSWYVTKNKSFNESDFLNVDSIKNAVSNTDQWLKIE